MPITDRRRPTYHQPKSQFKFLSVTPDKSAPRGTPDVQLWVHTYTTREVVSHVDPYQRTIAPNATPRRGLEIYWRGTDSMADWCTLRTC